MFPEVHTSTHQGIPVFWADLPGPLTGTLTFGVGTRDEPAPLMGITHLLEHLAFRAIDPLVVRHDGVVDDETLSFYATGDPAMVADFLNNISRALSTVGSISDQDLAREKGVVRAELEWSYDEPCAGLLTYRFGIGSLGNANANQPTVSALTAKDLEEWGLTWLSAQNAALSFTGPPPPELDVALPAGEIRPHDEPVGIAQVPCLLESPKTGVAVSMLVPWDQVQHLGAGLQFELTLRLRHELGLTYSIQTFTTRVDGRTSQIDLVLDPHDKNTKVTVQEVVGLMRRLCSDGFSRDAIEHAQADIATSLAWTSTTIAEYVDRLATGHVTGRSSLSPETLLSDAASLDSERLTHVLTEAMSTLIVAFDDNATLDKEWLQTTDLPVDQFNAWQTDESEPRRRRARRGEVWRARRKGDMPGQFAIFAGESIKTQDKKETVSICLADLKVLGRNECGCLTLIDSRGRDATVDPDDWSRGAELVKSIVDCVPAEIVRSFPSHGNRS